MLCKMATYPHKVFLNFNESHRRKEGFFFFNTDLCRETLSIPVRSEVKVSCRPSHPRPAMIQERINSLTSAIQLPGRHSIYFMRGLFYASEALRETCCFVHQ